MAKVLHEVQPPADLERPVVRTLELAEQLLGDAFPEVSAQLGALRVVHVVGQDVVDEVGRHVSRGGSVGPLVWAVAVGEAVAPVVFDCYEVAVEDFELCGELALPRLIILALRQERIVANSKVSTAISGICSMFLKVEW